MSHRDRLRLRYRISSSPSSSWEADDDDDNEDVRRATFIHASSRTDSTIFDFIGDEYE
jgi:hypothetical protein